jgi:hypothetical protein
MESNYTYPRWQYATLAGHASQATINTMHKYLCANQPARIPLVFVPHTLASHRVWTAIVLGADHANIEVLCMNFLNATLDAFGQVQHEDLVFHLHHLPHQRVAVAQGVPPA